MSRPIVAVASVQWLGLGARRLRLLGEELPV